MEKRTCKLCFKSFSNGRALGGHMRSHMLKLQTPLAPPRPPPPCLLPTHVHSKTPLIHQLEEDETDSASSSSSSSSEEDDKGLSYGLRENPKKSFRLVDPELSSFAVVDAGSVVQDRESETESSKNPSRRRSKRNRKSGLAELPQHLLLQNQESKHVVGMMKKPKPSNPIGTDQFLIEPEPVSSVSDTTPEEDVAWCLMMLSRGIRTRKRDELVQEDDEEEEKEEEEEEEDGEKSIEEESDEEELEEIKVRVKRSRGKYQCGTCKKFFRSYQALGGHRASHKKIKGCNTTITTPSSSSAARVTNNEAEFEQEGNAGSAIAPNAAVVDRRIHECPVCFRVFGSGQALGGHKRSHLTGSTSTPPPTRNANSTTRFGDNLIDLNLPAPMEDEDQIELSAVSDAEFIR